MAGKVLINCAHGKNNSEDATVALIAAAAATAVSDETAVFLSSDAVRLATHGYADDVQADGYEPLKTFLDAFLEGNGQLWVCPACAKARGMTQDDLIEGAEITGAVAVIEYLNSGAVTFM